MIGDVEAWRDPFPPPDGQGSKPSETTMRIKGHIHTRPPGTPGALYVSRREDLDRAMMYVRTIFRREGKKVQLRKATGPNGRPCVVFQERVS